MLKRIVTKYLLICLFGISVFAKDRVVILTDISNEPDDKMSMVRLMLYSNEIELEGLVATTSCWLKANPKPEQIEEVINAYALVRDNLLLHASGYPTSVYLKSLIKKGNTGYSMDDVGANKSSEGSQHIISVIDRDDPRPVWICIWCGANTLAQALWDVQNTRTTEELDRFIAKIRVYDLGGQDDSGAWMTHTFPYLYYIRSIEQWHGISYRMDNAWPESRGGDESMFSPEWVAENVQQDHGPMGAIYPDAIYLHEGDTPTYLYLLPTGLSNPNQPTWGCWGGRFTAEPQMNPWSMQPPVVNESNYKDFWMISEARDHWQWQDKVYDNVYCAIFRWRVDFQNDFAARMDWCVRPFRGANHNPTVILNGDSTKNVLIQRMNPGDQIVLDASKTHDIDGDSMLYYWWVYPEPGTYSGEISLTESDSSTLNFVVPADAAGKSIHLVLTVQDKGEPPLFAYRRVVFYVEPYTEIVDLTPPHITNAPDSHFVDYRTQVPIALTTDERAFLKFDYSDKTYQEMANDFTEGQGGIQHRVYIPAKQGQDVTIFVRAKDLAGNETSNAVKVNFSVDTLQMPINWKDMRYPNKWSKGSAPIGIGYNDIQTTLSNVNTFYLRTAFHIEHAQDVTEVKIRIRFEDGIVVYVNGQELRRIYMPQGIIGYNSTASRSNKPTSTSTVYVRNQDLALLVTGENQIAIEVHQAADGENDSYFDAEINVDNETILSYGSEWYYSDTGEEPPPITLRDILSNVSQNPVPSGIQLIQNYPNPFNSSTIIKFYIPYSSNVTIKIYDILGREVCKLVDKNFQAGSYQEIWEGKDNNGRLVASGIYAYKIQTKYLDKNKKMILIR